MPPVNPPYDPAWEKETWTTGEYMFPKSRAWNLSDEEDDAINELLNSEMDLYDEMLAYPHTQDPEAQDDFLSEHFLKFTYEFCFWYDREVTTEATDERMLCLVSAILHAYHYEIMSDGILFDVEWLLPAARAIRERTYEGEYGGPWDDEYP